MHSSLSQKHNQKSILSDDNLRKKLEFNRKQSEKQDQTELIEKCTQEFKYENCSHQYWNPIEFSLLHGTYLWEQASEKQKILLNQIYWIAYYSQIISAEVATIFFNQVAGAGLFAMEDFKILCDALDLESRQERCHINAFKTISEEAEWELFGERIFSYPMRGVFEHPTVIHWSNNQLKAQIRNLKLYGYVICASNSPFLASQYLTIRGIRTLNGKLVQHKLSKYYSGAANKETISIPSAISYHHFIDESFHFNTSKTIGLELLDYLPKPNTFDKWIVNKLISGCQEDHNSFSVAINGIFWHDPALFKQIHKILKSKFFGFDSKDIKYIMEKCFTEESDGMHGSYATYKTARESYIMFLDNLDFVEANNRKMHIMSKTSVEATLKTNKQALKKFFKNNEI